MMTCLNRDFSSHDHSISIIGATFNATGSNYDGGRMYFDGNDYIAVADDDALDIQGPLALTYWIRSSDSGNKVIFEKGAGDDLVIQPYGSGIFYLDAGSLQIQ